MVYCIALTGNVASGKSTAAKLFQKLGINVINADQIAKTLTQKGKPAFIQIYQHFGSTILTPTGEINRAKLRTVIFKNPEEKQWLEQLLHPLIREEIQQQVSASQSPYVIVEIPLLPSRAHYPYVNRILAIISPRADLLKRLTVRDNISEEDARAILRNQASETEHRKNADDIIVNDGSLERLEKKIHQYHQRYLEKS